MSVLRRKDTLKGNISEGKQLRLAEKRYIAPSLYLGLLLDGAVSLQHCDGDASKSKPLDTLHTIDAVLYAPNSN